jgi:KUP system potassium uptake protein
MAAANGKADEDKERLASICLAALGVVYGDIGTSPIYALRECFFGAGHVAPTSHNVLGILSLIVWALILTISVKYLVFVMRADNKGEGGIIALVALLNPWRAKPGTRPHVLMLLGLFGGALLYGDGTLTPAISVLSAVEGLQVATAQFQPYVVPITLAILIALFAVQHRGTGGLGAIFGPVIALWFLALAALGVRGILLHPGVLAALNPWRAVEFLLHDGRVGFLAMGSVFLAVTGGEALYADMGHFGRRPIRLAWFVLVLPALLLNYFGQGALLLHSMREGEVVHEPFYQLAPGWALYPLVGLATAATVIASQAVISGTFSLTRQLIQLGQLPLLRVVQTSHAEHGQIYIPSMNWALMFATLALVLGFKSSSALAAAYGIAVSATMVITTLLIYAVARRFGWRAWTAAPIALFFVLIDGVFFSANVFKVSEGGWYPLAVAGGVFMIMNAWTSGRERLRRERAHDSLPLDKLAEHIHGKRLHLIPGTAVFLTGPKQVPPHLLYLLERYRIAHRYLVLLTVKTVDEPRVPANERLAVASLAPDVYEITVRYGFMQEPNVPVALRLCQKLGLDIDLDDVTYYLSRETPVPGDELPFWIRWRDRLFALLNRNAMRATDFFQLPPERVVEFGRHVELDGAS